MIGDFSSWPTSGDFSTWPSKGDFSTWPTEEEDEVGDAMSEELDMDSCFCLFSNLAFNICNLSSSVMTQDFSIPIDKHFLNLRKNSFEEKMYQNLEHLVRERKRKKGERRRKREKEEKKER